MMRYGGFERSGSETCWSVPAARKMRAIVRAATVIAVLGIVCPGPAVAGERHPGKTTRKRSLRSPTDPPSIPIDFSPMRMRVETREGVLVVYDAASPSEADEGCSGYIGYWLSARDNKQYVFGTTLYDESDLSTILLALERDLGVDLESLAETDERIDEALRASAEAPNEEIVWEPATLHRAVEIMGFNPGGDPDLQETGDGQTAAVCDPGGCPASPGPPSNCGSPRALVEEALSVVADCCGGGGGGGGGCTGPCCGVNCYDGNSCTSDYCSNGICVYTQLADGTSCANDGNACTQDICSSGICVHLPVCSNTGDYCTDEYCSAGACVTGNGTLSCSADFVVDGEGQAKGYPYTRSACVVLPQGTDCVRLRVYYFSREYPEFTSQQSEFDDTISFQVAIPGEPLETGFVHVNNLHSQFGGGPYPGGNYLVLDRQYHLGDLTQSGPREVGLRATVTNVSDDALGSGVAFIVECAGVDLDFNSLAEEDELDPGGFLWLNDDDDNSNGIADMDDTGVVPGENDLVAVTISANNPLYPGLVDLSAPSGESRVKVYSNPDRSGPLPLTQYWSPEQLPVNVYVEGVAASLALRDVDLRVRRASCEDLVRITVRELRITETPGSFLPENSNTVAYTGTLLPPETVDVLRFDLFEVSDFPGDAMNHGTQSDLDPDLKFEATRNPGLTISSNSLTATTNTALNSATVTVSAFDFGGRGKIKATAINLAHESRPREVPKDTDEDWLPDVYESAQMSLVPNDADTDGDGVPDGQEDDDPERAVVADAGPNSHPGARTDQGLTGDGLTAFEEYRGFFMLGTHTRTTTSTKDVFVGIDAPPGDIPGGIGYFANLTGFSVHEIDVLGTAREWDDWTRRFINSKRSGIQATSDQRAIRVIRNDFLSGFGITLTPAGALANQSPNETDRIEVNVSLHRSGVLGTLAGADGIYGTADDAQRPLTPTEQDDAIRETVGHECGHGVHVEHHFILGDEHVFPQGYGEPNLINVTAGADGICNSTAVGTDVQTIPVGQGKPNSIVINGGADGVDPSTTLIGDDAITGNNVIAGPNGIAQTTARGNDVQVIAVGRGLANTDCVSTGFDGISNTTRAGDDVQQILVGRGKPNAIGIQPGPDGALQTSVEGDDTYGSGSTITSGPDGILQTYADPPAYGVPSIMTSDLLLPIPTTYKGNDLDQVRFHLKHP